MVIVNGVKSKGHHQIKSTLSRKGHTSMGPVSFTNGITRKAAELPAAQLFRQRATCAIGSIAQAKILVNLE
jgi:hypothetical protein